MSSPVSNPATTPAAAATAGPTTGPTGTSTTPVSQMFLQVLLEELSHQDPTNATDPTTMVTQLAQMTDVQETAQATQTTQFQTAVGLEGKAVTYQDPSTGNTTRGNVTGVGISSSGPTLTINGGNVPFGNLVSVP